MERVKTPTGFSRERHGLKPSSSSMCLTCMTRTLVQCIFPARQSKESRTAKTRSDKSWVELGELTRIHCNWKERTKEFLSCASSQLLLQIVQNKKFDFQTIFWFLNKSLPRQSQDWNRILIFFTDRHALFNVSCKNSVVHQGNAC